MLGSTLLLVSLKILYCKLLSFAVTVDVTDILQTSKHNFQFRTKHQKYETIKRQMIKKISCSLRLVILMSALFLLRYYGSCYRLQHVEKAKKKTQKRTRHVKEDRTCRSAKKKHAEKAKKGERRQKSKEKKRGQNCTLPGKTLSRLRSILYFSYQLLFKHFCILSWGAYSTNFHLFFL